MFEGETHSWETEKKLPNMCRYMNSTNQRHSLYEEVAEDAGKERQRKTSPIERRSSSVRREPKKAGEQLVGEKPQVAEKRK